MEKPSKKLIDKWNKKLKESGFEDIENSDGSLKAEIDPRTITSALKEKEIRENYFYTAREFLSRHNFDSQIEENIWSIHVSEGYGAVRIAKLLSITMYKADTTLAKLRRLAGLARKK